MIASVLALLKCFGGVAWGVLRAIPWQAWALAAVVVAFLWYGEQCADAREVAVRAEYREQFEREDRQQAAYEAEQKDKAAAVTEKVVTVYVDKVRTVYKTGATIIQEVPVYVPVDSPDLPGGFRVLHDAAAAGRVPDPAGVPDAAPVAAQVATATVVDNYTACHANTALLSAYQAWWTEHGASE